MISIEHAAFTIPAALDGKRLDAALAALHPAQSRTLLRQWIEQGRVILGEMTCRMPRTTVHAGDRLVLEIRHEPRVELAGQDVGFKIAYEDESLLVIDKPAGLVVHPGAGIPDRTLVNGLLWREAALSLLPRAGIIHRLDKDTSGLLLVARTPASFQALTRQMAAREIHRVYAAVAQGLPLASGRVEAPVGRDRIHRTRMRVTPAGRAAVTHYRVVRRFRAHVQLELTLETGRTHQIRVHLQHLGHPLVGDPVYAPRRAPPGQASAQLQACLAGFRRQALHACRLAFTHPATGAPVEVQSPLPPDFRRLLAALTADLRAAAEPPSAGRA